MLWGLVSTRLVAPLKGRRGSEMAAPARVILSTVRYSGKSAGVCLTGSAEQQHYFVLQI